MPPPPCRPSTPAANRKGTAPFYVVERGDWLSAIAARFLGDQDAYPRIQALNPDLEARDSRFPNHIEPAWRLILPSDAYDRGIRLHAAGTVQQPPASPTATPAEPDPTSSAGAETPTTTVDEPTPAVTGIPLPDADAAPPDVELDSNGDGHPDVIVGHATTGTMAGAGLLASLLFALLTAERRRQRGLYAAGQEPPRPTNGRAERELRAAQQPADVERLDAALRGLNDGLSTRTVPPDIVGVRLVGGDVQILLSQPADDPPPPWLDEGTQWALPAYVQPPFTAGPATLLPALVTIGSRAGRHLLIDLERLGTLSIGGHPHRARDLLRHMACELACNTWSDHATVILCGFGDEADTVTEIGPDRIVIADSASSAITTVRAELAKRIASGATVPATLLLVASPDASTRTALAELHQDLANTGRCGMAVVTSVPDGVPIGTAILTITETGQLRADVPGLRLSTDAATVPLDMLEPMAAVFRAARLTPATTAPSPAPTDLPPWDDTINPADGVLAVFEPTPPDIGPSLASPVVSDNGATQAPAAQVQDELDDDLAWNDGTNSPPRLGILGPIEVRMPGVLNDSRHRLYTEMLLYLLTRPTRGADRATIEDALWYGHPAGETTVRKVTYKLRQWLGPRPGGGEWIPTNDDVDGVYQIEDGILFDWHLLLQLNKRGSTRGADGIADLRAALELVRGAPMNNRPDTGPYRRPYTWIGDSDIAPGRLIATIAGIAHRVAEHHLAVGDPAIARWAIDRAWLADPERSFDDLWHDRMQAEHQAGNTVALQQLVNEYLASNEAEVPEDLPTPIYNRIRALLPAA